MLHHHRFDTVKACILADLPVYMPGPTGSGKTTLAQQIAQDLDLDFHFTGAVDSEFKLKGFRDAYGVIHTTPFRRAFEHGGLFMFDEIDASDPQALLTVNAAIANGYLDTPEGAAPRNATFRLIAAANTWGKGANQVYIGRNPLDASTLDRYVTVPIDYDARLERAMVEDKIGNEYVFIPQIVQALRLGMEQNQIRGVMSPRASLHAASLAKSGMPLTQSFEYAVWKDIPPDSRIQILHSAEKNLHALTQTSEQEFEELKHNNKLRWRVNDLSQKLGLPALFSDFSQNVQQTYNSIQSLKKTSENIALVQPTAE